MSSVLFVSGGGVGNIVQTTPIVHLVSQHHEVDWLIEGAKPDPIFKLPFVKNVLYNRPNKQYDIQLNGPFTSGRIYSRRSYRPRIDVSQHIPESEVNRDLAKQIGINDSPLKTFVQMEECNIEVPNDTVAIYPGSKPEYAMKRWDKYDDLARRFEHVLLIGTEDDLDSTGKPGWMDRPWNWPDHAKRFRGTLAATAHALSKCKLFVGNDGGLAHISAATGIPTYIIFGPTSIAKNKPPVENALAIHTNLKCQPCQFRNEGWFTPSRIGCPFGMPCLAELSVDYVMNCIT